MQSEVTLQIILVKPTPGVMFGLQKGSWCEIKKYIKGEGGYVIMSDRSSVNVSRSRKELLLKKFVPG
jgi:hypothetical protein